MIVLFYSLLILTAINITKKRSDMCEVAVLHCIEFVGLQLACARINSQEGQDYLKGMAAAANYAWVNRSTMTFLTRQAFGKVFKSTPDDLDMHVIYDVSHNIAKIEEHVSFAGLLTCSVYFTSLSRFCTFSKG